MIVTSMRQGDFEKIHQDYAEALSQDPEFYSFSRRLEAYNNVLKQGDTAMAPANSEFFSYLINDEAPETETEAILFSQNDDGLSGP